MLRNTESRKCYEMIYGLIWAPTSRNIFISLIRYLHSSALGLFSIPVSKVAIEAI